MTSAPVLAGPGVDHYRRHFEDLLRLFSEPSWLRDRRRAAFERFADRGFPSPRDEAWRQTSVARIVSGAFEGPLATGTENHGLASSALADSTGPAVVFVAGRQAAGASRSETPGVEILGLRQLLEQAPARLEAHLAPKLDLNASAFADLNLALHEDGAVVLLAPGAVVKEPIHVVFASASSPNAPCVSHPRVLIVAGRGSKATVVESYRGVAGHEYLTNAVTEVRVEDGAEVDHYRLQQESEFAFHVGRLAVEIGREGRFTQRSFSFGGALARVDLDVALAGDGSACTLDGLFFTSGDRHTDIHTRVDHLAPRCVSRQLYKGVLDGRGRGVFHGLVVVRPGAQKTDAVQSNRNLLLSKDALVSSTPQLEILADDVKCKHGSTTGQLDAAALFYLRSRGIGEAEARGLLTRAFAGELVQRIGVEAVRTAVLAELSARLPGGPAGEGDAA